MTGLGSDIAALDDGDLDPMFGEMSGPALVGADLRAELLTAEASLFYDRAHGFDVRSLLGARLTDQRRAQFAARIEAVCLRDDRVASVDVRVTGSLVIEVDGLTSTNEPFHFVLDAADAAARLSEPST